MLFLFRCVSICLAFRVFPFGFSTRFLSVSRTYDPRLFSLFSSNSSFFFLFLSLPLSLGMSTFPIFLMSSFCICVNDGTLGKKGFYTGRDHQKGQWDGQWYWNRAKKGTGKREVTAWNSIECLQFQCAKGLWREPALLLSFFFRTFLFKSLAVFLFFLF